MFSTINSKYISSVSAEVEVLREKPMPSIPSLNAQKDYGTLRQEGVAMIRKGWIWMLLLIVPVGIRYLIKGRELMADDVFEALMKDQRKPVIYLRSFAADKQRSKSLVDLVGSASTGLFYSPSIELKIFQGLPGNFKRKFGPYIGIAEPGDFPPCLGVSKCYVEDRDWKRALLWMLEKSQLAVVRIGQGDGLFWELAVVLLLFPRERILLVIDPTSVPDRELRQTYDKMSRDLSDSFKLRFPENISGSRVFTISSEGEVEHHKANVLTAILTGNPFGMSIRKATTSIPTLS